MKLYTTHMKSPIGWILLQATENHLCTAKWVAEPITLLDDLSMNQILQKAVGQLKEYFAGERTEFDLPLQQTGTPFEQQVWSELLKIPYGETINYKELAVRIGNPNASRAAGSANGKNNIFIIVPCHRVVQYTGKTGGYAYGTEMKDFLLNLEKGVKRKESHFI